VKTTHRIVMTDEYIADAQRLSIAQNKTMKFFYQTWWAWWLPRIVLIGMMIYFGVVNFDWNLEAVFCIGLAVSFLGDWLGRYRLARMRKRLRSDKPITVSMDENGVDVVAENSNSHSNWAGILPSLVYPHGVLLKFSRLSGIWLPDSALTEGSPDDVRKLLTENVKDSAAAS
jgi:hypothetical protein